jgi:hypothetical protein
VQGNSIRLRLLDRYVIARSPSGILGMNSATWRSPSKLLTSEERHTIDKIHDIVHEKADGRACRIILFGIKARGDSNENSDIDLAIIVSSPEIRKRKKGYCFTS